MTQTYPLPKKPMEYNNLTRIINFDIAHDGTFFIETNREYTEEGTVKIWAYKQDVKDDRISIFKKSQAMQIKKRAEKTFSVRKDLYKLFGTGALSKDLSFAIILPDTAERLPKGIRDDPLWYELFSNLIEKKDTEATQITHLEEKEFKLSEAMARGKTEDEMDKSLSLLEKIKTKIFGEKESEKKPKE